MRIANSNGFTLVELLVTVSIIGILVAIFLPAVHAVREASRRSSCANNQRQFALAIHSYESGVGFIPPTIGSKQKKEFLLHWQAILTPFLDQKPVFSRIKENLENGIHVFHMTERVTRLPSFECPSDPENGFLIQATTGRYAFTSYCGVGGVQLEKDDGVFVSLSNETTRVGRGISFAEIRDGLSNTLMIGERPPNDAGTGYGAWLGSQNPTAAAIGVGENRESLVVDISTTGCEEENFDYQPAVRGSKCGWTHHWSYHPGGANFAMSDGSVHFVSYEIETTALHALATRAAGDLSEASF